ncbi:HAD domain-containing protein [Paraburkholderia sp. BR10937]|uniref:HAD domain-containing protein n=1 Tax=Paraburkholderia sp. BR10937 TaxID=3236994 RepID=UPI0034D1BEB6
MVRMLTGLPGEAYLIPPPRSCGGLVLYLDYDGVLHPDAVCVDPKRGPILVNRPGHLLFENVGILIQLLSPYPAVKVVLSTSWVRRYRGSIRRVSRGLTPALQTRVIGGTFHSRMDPGTYAAAPRGWQIWSDVTRRRPARWLALDDDDESWPAWCRDQLVHTDSELGISAPRVRDELQAKLAAMVRE